MTTDINKFYDKIEELKIILTKILEHYSLINELNELNDYYSKLLLIKKINMRKPVEIFYEKAIVPNISNIINKNDDLIINKAQEEIDNLKDTSMKDEGMTIFNYIKSVWKLIDQNKRDTIWQYIRVISVLSERISGGVQLTNSLKKI